MSCFVSVALLFLLLGCSSTEGLRNATLNGEIDDLLLQIEKSVKDRNLTEFAKNFHSEFDAQAWFKRYYAELTEDQLDSFLIRRFGHAEREGDHFKFKLSESRNIGSTYNLRVFVARTKSMPSNPLAIVELTKVSKFKRLD